MQDVVDFCRMYLTANHEAFASDRLCLVINDAKYVDLNLNLNLNFEFKRFMFLFEFKFFMFMVPSQKKKIPLFVLAERVSSPENPRFELKISDSAPE